MAEEVAILIEALARDLIGPADFARSPPLLAVHVVTRRTDPGAERARPSRRSAATSAGGPPAADVPALHRGRARLHSEPPDRVPR
jgi:hypothetical protein